VLVLIVREHISDLLPLSFVGARGQLVTSSVSSINSRENLFLVISGWRTLLFLEEVVNGMEELPCLQHSLMQNLPLEIPSAPLQRLERDRLHFAESVQA